MLALSKKKKENSKRRKMNDELKDKLAEKVLDAMDKVGPLTDELMRQYIWREAAYAWTGGILSLAGLILCGFCINKLKTEKVGDDLWVVSLIIFGVTSLFTALFLCEFISAFAHTFAPLPSILGL